jgi:hypothetical protein
LLNEGHYSHREIASFNLSVNTPQMAIQRRFRMHTVVMNQRQQWMQCNQKIWGAFSGQGIGIATLMQSLKLL